MINKIEVGDKQFELYIEKERISERIAQIALELNKDYEGRCPYIVGVLNGSFLFMADLLREMKIDCEVGFIKVSSYEGTESSGKIKEVFGVSEEFRGRNVILVEDIIDTGFTLKFIMEKVIQEQPASVSVCTLLYKPEAIQLPVTALKYSGFEIPNDFVVGYGLDYNGLGRNLKDIYRVIAD